MNVTDLRFCCCFIIPYICSCLCSDEEDEDDDGEDDLPPGTPRVHSKVSVVATLADLKDNVMHKELAQKVSFSFSNKATDTFNISVVWGRLYNAQKTHIIQNFSGFEVGHELKPDEEHSVEYAFVPHKQLEAGAEYFVELLGYFTPLVNTQSKHYIHTAFNATVKLHEKPGKFTGPMIFSLSLICIIVGGLYMIKNQIGPFSKKQKGFAQAPKSSSKTSSDDGNGFLDPQHAKHNMKKVSSK
jgi:hypothetical protein